MLLDAALEDLKISAQLTLVSSSIMFSDADNQSVSSRRNLVAADDCVIILLNHPTLMNNNNRTYGLKRNKSGKAIKVLFRLFQSSLIKISGDVVLFTWASKSLKFFHSCQSVV